MRRYRYSACRETLLPELCPDAGTARDTGRRTAFPGCAAKDLCAEPFRISSFHPPGRQFSQNPPRTHPDSTACMTMLPIPRKIPSGVECRRCDTLLQHFIPVGGFVGSSCRTNLPELRRTADVVCSRTTVSGHRRFNSSGRTASSAEYRACERKAAAENHWRKKSARRIIAVQAELSIN